MRVSCVVLLAALACLAGPSVQARIVSSEGVELFAARMESDAALLESTVEVETSDSAAVSVATTFSASSAAAPGAGVYSHTIASELMFFASAAYCADSAIAAWNCPVCANSFFGTFKPTKTVTSPLLNTFAFTGFATTSEGKAIVLVFRGTNLADPKSVLADLQLWHSEHVPSGGDVHTGFQKSWESIAPQVLPEVKRLVTECPTCRVFVAGHSLGGALATMAAAGLVSTNTVNPEQMTTYALGSPRVGDATFVAWFNQRCPYTWRPTHASDAVTKLPPTWWPLSYRHVGTEVWYPSSKPNEYRVCATRTEDRSCVLSTPDLNVVAGIVDHGYYFGRDVLCEAGINSLLNAARTLNLDGESFLSASSRIAERAMLAAGSSVRSRAGRASSTKHAARAADRPASSAAPGAVNPPSPNTKLAGLATKVSNAQIATRGPRVVRSPQEQESLADRLDKMFGGPKSLPPPSSESPVQPTSVKDIPAKRAEAKADPVRLKQCAAISVPSMPAPFARSFCENNSRVSRLFPDVAAVRLPAKIAAYCTFSPAFRACYVCAFRAHAMQANGALEACQSKLSPVEQTTFRTTVLGA